MSMDIYAKPGTKVKFTGEGGYDSDKHVAFSYMKVGDVFTVKNIHVGNWVSYVEFEEFPTLRFNTVMFDEVEDNKKAFWDAQEDFAKAMQEGAEKWDSECNEFWNKLSYDEKLKAFHSVCKRIYEADVVKEGTFRYALYEVFGFGPDAYLIGMESGYMDLHNYIQEGKASHRDYVEKDKNEHL